jgi:hypothetical protein
LLHYQVGVFQNAFPSIVLVHAVCLLPYSIRSFHFQQDARVKTTA